VKLTVFPSGKGDCLLLEAASGEHVLVDGGTRDAYRSHVAGVLGALRDGDQAIDLAMVSHADSDHIGGILQLLDDEVAWRVHEYQRSHGNPNHRRPERDRPPIIRELWLNGFGEQLDEDALHASDLLGRTASLLAASPDPDHRAGAADRGLLAQSIPEALRTARRASAAQLGIPTNPGFAGGLVVGGSPDSTRDLGSLRLRIVGPAQADIDRYREEWRKWLRANEETLKRIQERAVQDEALLRQGEDARLLGALIAFATELGDRTKVTPPNLASIMVLVEEDGARLLLTGDGHGDDLLAGLESSGAIGSGEGLHVDVFKVQHHGSEHNISEAFTRRVTADEYVFCGNGEHQNPDLRVVRAIAASRLGTPAERSQNTEVEQPFTFTFNTSAATTRPSAADHVKAIEALAKDLVAGSGGRMSARFVGDRPIEIDIGSA
jgi:beta-lactamase superfamily II metal-dependent hydrolase